MPCEECENGRVACGEGGEDPCGGAGGNVIDLGVAYIPVGIGSLYMAVDVKVLPYVKDEAKKLSAKVFLTRHCHKQPCSHDDDGGRGT